jgi:hypothetical protein
MKAIDRRLRRLEERFAPQENEEVRSFGRAAPATT